MVSAGSTSAKAARISPRSVSDSGVRASRVVSTRMVGKRQRIRGVSSALRGAEYVMRERSQQGEAEFCEPTTHAIEGT